MLRPRRRRARRAKARKRRTGIARRPWHPHPRLGRPAVTPSTTAVRPMSTAADRPVSGVPSARPVPAEMTVPVRCASTPPADNVPSTMIVASTRTGIPASAAPTPRTSGSAHGNSDASTLTSPVRTVCPVSSASFRGLARSATFPVARLDRACVASGAALDPVSVLLGVDCTRAAPQSTLATLRRPGVWPPPPHPGDSGGPPHGRLTFRYPDTFPHRRPVPSCCAQCADGRRTRPAWCEVSGR